MLLSIISIIVVAIVASVIAAVVTSKVCAARFNVVARPEVVTPSDEVVVPSVGKVKTVTLETTNETKVAEVVPVSPKAEKVVRESKTKKHFVGEVNESGKVWSEYAPGKFGWRAVSGAKKVESPKATETESTAKVEKVENAKTESPVQNVVEDKKPADKKVRKEGARKVGDLNAEGTKAWTEYAEGKFGWRSVKCATPTKTKNAETPNVEEKKEVKSVESKNVETKTSREPKAPKGLNMRIGKCAKEVENAKGAKDLQTIIAKWATYENGADILASDKVQNAINAKTATFKPAETKQKPNQADSKNNRRMENLKKQHEAAKAKAKNNEPKSVEELNAKEEAEKQAAKVASAIAAIEKCETVEEYLKVVNGLGEKMYHNQEVANIRDAWNNDYIERQKAIKAIKDAKTLDEYHAIVDVLSSEQRGRNDMEAARTDWENRFYAENEKNDAKKSGKKNNKPATTPVNSEDATYANNVKSTFVTKVYAMMVKNANCQKVTLKKSVVEYSKNGKNLKVESIARIPENNTDLVITFKDGEKSKGWNVTALNGTSKELRAILDKVSAAVKKELTA